MKPLRCITALVSCLLLAGCAARDAMTQVLASAPAASLHVRPDAPAAPDLRIPADAVASTQEIPLVPVPPIPLGRGAAPQASDAPRPNLAPPPQPVLPPTPATTAALTQISADAPAAASARTETKLDSLRQLQRQALAWYAGVDSYIVRMTRREQVNGVAKPEEVMLFKFRKEPWSVHFKWIGKVGHDREVLYVKGQYDNKLHTRLAAGDAPLMPAGMKMALDLDSVMVRSASRHSITEAGIGACIERFGGYLDANERGDRSRGALNDLGLQKRPEFSQPVRTVELAVPPGVEQDLPNGGRRLFFVDPDLHIPMLIVTYDDKNQEVEYYHYDRLIAPASLDASDFDPDRLWNSPKTTAKAQ